MELTKAHPDPISATKNRFKNASSGPAYYRELEILHTWIDRKYRVREIEARVLDTFLPWRRKAFDGTVGKTETWAEFVYPSSAINKQKSSFHFYAFIEATTKQVAVVKAAPISGYLYKPLKESRSPIPIVDNLDWVHLLTRETRPIVDWSLLVEAVKSGKSLADQDILLDKNIGNGVADWDILPIKRVWGIFSFNRGDT